MKKKIIFAANALLAATLMAASPSLAEGTMPSAFHGEGSTVWVQQASAGGTSVNATGSINRASQLNQTSGQPNRSGAPIFGRGTGTDDSYGSTYRLGDK